MSNKKTDINDFLKSISKYKLNRLVQSELFSHDYKQFSGFVKQMLNSTSQYGLIMSKLQEGLYNLSGVDLKRRKNVENYNTDRNSITQYMSAMELIRYREGINSLMHNLDNLSRYSFSYNNVYETALNTGHETFKRFYKYSCDENAKMKENFFDFSGVSLNDSILKNYKKGTRMKLHKKMLSVLNLKSDKKLSTDSELDFNAYSNIYINNYNSFRKNFVKVVKKLSSSPLKFTNSEIATLFSTYERAFYRTNYLKDKNIFVIDYALGLDKDFYFKRDNLKIFEKQINSIMEQAICVEKDRFLPNSHKFTKMNNSLHKKGVEDRQEYLHENFKKPDFYEIPETSSAFLAACLQNIAYETYPEHFDSIIANVPQLFSTKAYEVEKSIVNNSQPIDLYQPTFFDDDFLQQ